MKNLKAILVIWALALSITSCEKGETGAQGPVGPQGGANITDGTFSVSSGTWLGPYLMSTGGIVYYKDIPVSFITSDFKENGIVMVYRKISYANGSYSYAALPYSEVYSSQSTRLWSFEVFTGTLRILIQNTDDDTHSYGSTSFRVVAISGNRMASHPNINLNNYEEVKAALGLSD